MAIYTRSNNDTATVTSAASRTEGFNRPSAATASAVATQTVNRTFFADTDDAATAAAAQQSNAAYSKSDNGTSSAADTTQQNVTYSKSDAGAATADATQLVGKGLTAGDTATATAGQSENATYNRSDDDVATAASAGQPEVAYSKSDAGTATADATQQVEKGLLSDEMASAASAGATTATYERIASDTATAIATENSSASDKPDYDRVIIKNISVAHLVIDTVDNQTKGQLATYPYAKTLAPLEELPIPVEAYASIAANIKARWAGMARRSLIEVWKVDTNNEAATLLSTEEIVSFVDIDLSSGGGDDLSAEVTSEVQRIIATNDFDGTAPSGAGVITNGTVVYPAETAGGLFALDPMVPLVQSNQLTRRVTRLTLKLSGQSAWSVSLSVAGLVDVVLVSGTTETDVVLTDVVSLNPGDALKVSTTGATGALTAQAHYSVEAKLAA